MVQPVANQLVSMRRMRVQSLVYLWWVNDQAWLWLAAAAQIGLLAWEPPYASGEALKSKKKKKKKKKKKRKEKKKKKYLLVPSMLQWVKYKCSGPGCCRGMGSISGPVQWVKRSGIAASVA